MKTVARIAIGAVACGVVTVAAPLIGEPEPGFVSAAILLIGGMLMKSVP